MRATTSAPAALSARRKALIPVFSRAGYPAKDVDAKGPQMGLRFVVKHRDMEWCSARDFVENVMDARREPGGGWMDVSIRTPSGEQVAVYLSRDASYSQRRTAWNLTRAARALRATAPTLSLEVAKAASAVVCQRKEVVTCKYIHDTNRDFGTVGHRRRCCQEGVCHYGGSSAAAAWRVTCSAT